MTRKVVLDTETTGLDWRQGHRVIEIGCVELLGRKPSGRRLHRYVNPEREIDRGAAAVHGLSNEFLADKPVFGAVVEELLEFVAGAELVIHNAQFDIGFLDDELGRLGRPALDQCIAGVIDTLKLAKEMFPGRKASLDVLCERFEIDNSRRTLHGALLDAELLAEVYLAMTRGQESLLMDLALPRSASLAMPWASRERPPLLILYADAAELAAHEQVLQDIGRESKGRCVWLTQ